MDCRVVDFVQAFWLRRHSGVFELQRGLAGVWSSIGCVVVQPCRGARCVTRQCCQLWQQQCDCCGDAVRDLGSEHQGAHSAHSCLGYGLGCGQRCCLSRKQRPEWSAKGHCFCWRAAGQLECRCKLRRAERELCWCEQCREQRGHERECCWAQRDGRERVECWRAAWVYRVRGQRLGQRQCCCVQSARRRVRRCCGGCVCWCHAGQRQRAGKLRRSECELCCCEQCREQRGCECDGCGAGRSGCELRKQQERDRKAAKKAAKKARERDDA